MTTEVAYRKGAVPQPKAPRRGRTTSLYAHGEPMVWLTGGALALSLFMIAGLVVLVVVQGARTFTTASVWLFWLTAGLVRQSAPFVVQ